MCGINAFFRKTDGTEELLLEDVDSVRKENGTIHIRSIFGEVRSCEGDIREVSQTTHRIVIVGA
ncbi:MAG: CooT family nickel-binding protein [Nitrospirota bacterium]|nr:CooT family nickel-binding protein [Nitrospirota bacterium]